jgi:hypothetical protein
MIPCRWRQHQIQMLCQMDLLIFQDETPCHPETKSTRIDKEISSPILTLKGRKIVNAGERKLQENRRTSKATK